MSFLAPLFLAGALAIGLPIVFHLIRRTTRERTLFSSLMFLTASPPRLVKRNRIEHLLLLLLRCAVICLFALGFARPFFRRPIAASEASAPRKILLLVDASASMRRANLWANSLDRVKSALRDTTPVDQVALYLFDQQLKPLFTFDQWKNSPPADRSALLLQQLKEQSPSWSSTRLGSALIQAAEVLTDSADKTQLQHGRIVLITDLHEGNRIEPLEGYDWPKGVEVFLQVLKPSSLNNASLQLVPESDDSSSKSAPNVRVRVVNAAVSKEEQFKIGWALSGQSGFAGKPVDVYVPAGQSRVVTLPAISSGEALSCIRLQGDDEEFDNLVFTAPPESTRLNVVYIGNDLETESRKPLYFLKRAFQETRHQSVRVDSHQPGDVIPASEAQAASLFVVTSPLPSAISDALRERALAGKTVLVACLTPEIKRTLSRLLGVGDVPFEEVRPSNYALLGELDFRHPIFAPFADPRFSDFTKIHFWKYAKLDSAAIPSARAFARFDSGDPAFIEVTVGTGKVYILTSGWHPEFSQLALSSKFVPLLYSLLETSGAPQPPQAQYWVGDSVPIGALFSGASPGTDIVLPDGSRANLGPGVTNFTRTELPGLYTATTAGNSRRFVINLDPTESKTSPVSPDELERLGVPVFHGTETQRAEAVRKAHLQNAELENRQKIWRWCIVVALFVLLFESWLAGRSARRNLQPASAFST